HLGRQHPHGGQLLGLLDLALEMEPRLRLRDAGLPRFLEALGHPVELPGQLAELVRARHVDALAEVAAADRASPAGERTQRPRDAPARDRHDGDDEAEQYGQAGEDALADGLLEVPLDTEQA